MSDNPYIDTVWKSESISDGEYLVTPDGSWDLIAAWKADGTCVVFLTGQVTKPARVQYHAGERSVVISFAPGAYLPFMKGAALTNDFLLLPLTDDNAHFRLADHTFELPTYENAEQLIDKMVSQNVLQNDDIVHGMLQGTPKAASTRSVQRHFKAVTGITHKNLTDIRRAQQAVRLLKDGKNPSRVAADAGYYDQPHLTKSLKRLMDSSPTDVDDVNQV